MNDKWMKDLRNLVRAYERKAPEGLLDDIRREMAVRGPVPVSQPAVQPRRNLWRRMAAAAGIAALLGTGTVTYLYTDTGETPQTSALPAPPAPTRGTASGTGVLPPSESTAATALLAHSHATHATAPHTRTARTFTAPMHQAAHAEETALPTTENTAGQPAVDMGEPRPTVSVPTGTDTPLRNRPAARPTPLPSPRDAARTVHTNHSPGRGWQVSAYYAGSLPGSLSAPDAAQEMTVMMSSPYSEPKDIRDGGDLPALSMVGIPPIQHEKHRRPIKVGLSVSFPLAGRWSLHAGLTYSRLTSEITQETPVSVTQTTQKLHYVGIPVSLSYRLWQFRSLSLYAKAGSSIEQLAGGKAVSRHTEGISLTTSAETGISEHRPVFSTHAAMGVAFRPHPSVSIFAEPGAEYYFNNGSGIRSSYTDRPLNFSLSVGMRLNIR